MRLVEVPSCQDIRGIRFPDDIKFRQIIITGPPGVGKTRLITQIRGWPEEGYIDLGLDNWWRAQTLNFRPREVHLGIPFVGHAESLSVFDDIWLDAPEPLAVDFARIRIPPEKKWFLGTEWRNRFEFEFFLPTAEQVLQWRMARAEKGTHHADKRLSLTIVQRSMEVFLEIAVHFVRNGMGAYVRNSLEGPPKRIKLDEGEDLGK